jgi:hypothetical protein
MRSHLLAFTLAGLTVFVSKAPGQLQSGLGVQNWPGHGGYRTTVGYRGIVITSAVPGSEPAAGQLRAFPLVAGPLAVAGVPGDPSGVWVPPITPDVTFLGPSQHVVGYGGVAAPDRRRLFPTPPGGSGLPLVTHGGFSPDTYPLPPPYAGYYGTVTPVYSAPNGTLCPIDATGP